VFGDLNDSNSAVSKIIKKRQTIRIVNSRIDTEPNIYYAEGTTPLGWPVEPKLPGNVRMSEGFWKQY
jgi:hypothetical protein